MINDYFDMAKAIRFLSIDAVQKAASGHPGMPLGMADVATVLFAEFLRHNPDDPNWFNRDRFILSNGHGSMLLYSILYLTGYIGIDEIKNFRQLGSKTPGHPEHGLTPGVEVTTGPLGQGFACSVGMAIAEAILRERFGSDSVNHYTYVMLGDGCLMEGVSSEAASLAGHLRLNKLIALFDDNNISIDGSVDLALSDDITARFLSYGWNVESIDGHNYAQISNAIKNAHNSDKPSLIRCKTTIGKFVVEYAGKSSAHSGPFKESAVLKMRQDLNWEYEPFIIPQDILNMWKETIGRARSGYTGYNKKLNSNAELKRIIDGSKPSAVKETLENLKKQIFNLKLNEATRRSFGRVMEELTKIMPELIGGSADLTDSNCTKYPHMQIISRDNFNGSYIHFGVREHAMAACMNGMALHGGILPYGGTFLVFSDYCRPAIRLSVLMKQQVIYVMTHDSIGLGEDGPTHQPIEHLASLRAIPNLFVFRPADALETLECLDIALSSRDSPSLFVLSRQNLNYIDRPYQKENLCERGGYILSEYEGNLDVTIFATGSEVEIAIEAKNKLQQKGIGARVVSMPCWQLFDKQSNEYKSEILDNSSIKVAIEAGSSIGWHKYIGYDGIFVGMESFGCSAPYKKLYSYFGINVDNVVRKVLNKLKL
ncbi:transketolase [Candidatus Mesenet endosymbiont of Agriotes lineatus]|uniref:transketolase n=1 Tax=Candidatus Mesenet endosymbiont of Agriotes lineatus TaxID=3077948 RepID=UPI0030D17CB9